MKHSILKSLWAGMLISSLLTTTSAMAASLSLNFTSASGTILDTNGIGTGFTARLAGTGAAITNNDPNLLLNTGGGYLQMHTSPGADFNGQVAMDTATVVGVQLSTLGFNGGNDFTATAEFTSITNLLLQPDQLCLVVATDSTTGVRAGFINFSQFHATNTDANEGFATLMSGGTDAYDRFFGSTVGSNMTVVISRIGGTWSVTVNGIDRMPNSQANGTGTPEPPTVVGLDAATDLFVGVVAMDVGNDSPWNANLKQFTVSVSGNSAPSIAVQPQKQLVDEGNPATFSVVAGDNSKAPVSYQWYRNAVPLPNQTNTTFTLNPLVADVGSYSVVLTNSLGSITSSPTPLYVVAPKGRSSLTFATAGGGLLDTNGLGIGFSTRLPGTGADYTGDDPNLFLDTNNSVLDITSTTGDYNGGTSTTLATNESPGVSLATLGFTGKEDLNASLIFPTLPATASFDQAGVYVGIDTNYITRAGWIDFTAFSSPRGKERYSENIQPGGGGVPANGGGQYFGFGFDPSILPMTVLISRSSGIWHYYIDGVRWDVLTQPASIMDTTTNLTAGIFVYDTGAGAYTQAVSNFAARVFDPPGVYVTNNKTSLTLTWNVVGAGLQSNSSLTNPSGWTPVPGTVGTNVYVIPLPTTGSQFYRVGL